MANTSKYRQLFFNYIDYKYGHSDYSKIKNKIDDLFLNIKNGTLQFPVLNDNNTNIFAGSNFTNLPFIEFINNHNRLENTYTGFNQIKIYDTVRNPIKLYGQIKSNHLQYFIRLKNAFSNLNSNLYYIKQFQEFYNEFKLVAGNTYEYSIHPSKIYNEDTISYDFSIMTFILLEEFLLSIRKKMFDDVNYNIRTAIYNTARRGLGDIKDDFSNYIIANQDNISLTISEFIIQSALGLDKYSDDYLNRIKSKVEVSILKLIPVFNATIKRQINNTFQLSIVENIHDSIFDKFIHKQCIVGSSLFTLPNQYDFNEDYLLFQKIMTFITKNYKNDIKSLEYIAYQFNKTPVQFINAHYYIYNEFLQNNLDKEEIKHTYELYNEEEILTILSNLQINISRISNIYLHEYSVTGSLYRNTNYYARVKQQNVNGIWGDWCTPISFSTILSNIETIPFDNSINVSLTPLLTLKSFNAPIIVEHMNTRWQISTNSLFTNIISDSLITNSSAIHKSTYLVPGSLTTNTTYWSRMKYQDSNGVWSDWSQPIVFLTISYIDIIYPIDTSQNVSIAPTLKLSSFNIENNSTNLNSHWQISTDVDFNIIVRDSQVPSSILPTIEEIIDDKSIEQGCNSIYINWIYAFVDSAEFEEFLFEFIGDIKLEIYSRFKTTDENLHSQLFTIRQFFKLFFCKQIYDGVLFQNETNIIKNIYIDNPKLFSISSDSLSAHISEFKSPDYSVVANIQARIANFYIDSIIATISRILVQTYSV